ncbi:MAG TPA: ACT domain-containing protein [Clostridia bacterium]|jgi:ACT domain-containing protein|nr:ACT domain-containing protein [Clostridia bacterium]
MKKIITLDVLKNNYGNQKKIEFPQGTIVTPEARIWAKNQGIELLVDNEYLDLSVNSNYSNDKTSKVVVSVIGLDKVGIIAGVSQVLAQHGVNILDISQTTLQGLFVMITIVDIANCTVSFEQLKTILDQKGEELGVKINAQHEDVFKYMHRI